MGLWQSGSLLRFGRHLFKIQYRIRLQRAAPEFFSLFEELSVFETLLFPLLPVLIAMAIFLVAILLVYTDKGIAVYPPRWE